MKLVILFDDDHSFHREKVFVEINNEKFETLLKSKHKGIVFIYGEWCEHSDEHKRNFVNFATHLKTEHSKLNFYILHIQNLKDISVSIIDNPTVLKLKGNGKYGFIKIDHQFDFMLNQEDYFRNKVKDLIMHNIKSIKKLEKLINSKHETILLMTGGKNSKYLKNFLKIADHKYHYQPAIIMTSSEEILNNYNFQKDSLFLYRKEDKKWIKYDYDNNFFMHKIINWVFVHSHPHVLQMEKQGYEKIIHHENNAFILFLEDTEENINSNNRMIEEFEEAATKIPESFIKTICYVGKPNCNKLVNEIDMNLENEKLPLMRILMENNSHYMIIYDNINFINKDTILQFYNNFLNGKTMLYLKEEELSDEIDLDEEIIVNLNTSNIDEFLNIKQFDRLVFYYTKKEEKWIDFIKEIVDIIKETHIGDLRIGLYNIDKNTKFIVKDYKLPMVKMLKKEMESENKFWYQQDLKNENDVLLFLLDNSSHDYSEIFKEHDF